MHNSGNEPRFAVCPNKSRGSARRFMHAGNVFSLVKRTLFEANSRTGRSEKKNLTSAQTRRLIRATPNIVNPGPPTKSTKPRLGPHGCHARNFIAHMPGGKTESDALPAVKGDLSMRKAHPGARFSIFGRLGKDQRMNDNELRPVTIIVGRVWKRKGGKALGVHVMLVAPDDDSAVRTALDSLAKEGYAEVELDQIGDMEGEPDEEPHLSAYQGALEGEVSIVTFDAPG
jgi:hypothetical protein